MTQFLKAETRTVPTLASVPTGHLVKWINNIDTGPRLGLGEFAVIDPRCNEPTCGELYLIRWKNNGMELVQALRREGSPPTWWSRSVYSIDRRGRIDIPANRYVDGPRDAERFKQSLMGRCVGIYQAASNKSLIASCHAFGLVR